MNKNKKSIFSGSNAHMYGLGLIPLLGLFAFSIFGWNDDAEQPQEQVRTTEVSQGRRPPTDRFIFRGGENRSVIHTRSGWTSLGFDGVDPREYGSEYFGVHTRVGGASVYVPFGLGQNSYSGPPTRSSATYEIVSPPRRDAQRSAAATEGHYESRASEEVIEGDYVQVFHPAVFEIDDQGTRHLVKSENTTMEPKVRIVIRKVWIAGGPGDDKQD